MGYSCSASKIPDKKLQIEVMVMTHLSGRHDVGSRVFLSREPTGNGYVAKLVLGHGTYQRTY